MPHFQTDDLNGLLLFDSESEDSTDSSAPSRTVRSAMSAFAPEPAPAAPLRPPVTPVMTEPSSTALPRTVVAPCWRTVPARWILPVAAAIILVAPSLVVVSHAPRARANVDRVVALPRPPLSAMSAAHGVTPPPGREPLAAAMPHGEASAQEAAVRRALHSYQDAYARLDVAAAAAVWPASISGPSLARLTHCSRKALTFRTARSP